MSQPTSPTYQLIESTAPYPDTLFQLSPGPMTRAHIGVLGGQAGKVADFSALFELLSALRLPIELFVPAALAESRILPVPVHSLAEIRPDARARHELLEELGKINVLFAGIDSATNSQFQIFIEQLLHYIDAPIVITDELVPVFVINPQLLQLENIVPVLSVKSMIRLYRATQTPVRFRSERGVYNMGDFLAGLPSGGPLLITYQSDRIYIYVRAQHTVLHTARPQGFDDYALRRAILGCLAMTSFARSGQADQTLERAACALFLLHSLSGADKAQEWASTIVTTLEQS